MSERNKLRVRNFRMKQRLKEETLDPEDLENTEVPKKILHIENDKVVEQVHEVEDIQDTANKTKESDTDTPIIGTKYNYDELLEEANLERFSSDEETDSGDSDDDSPDAANEFIETDFIKNLKKWFFTFNVPNTHLDALLKTLKPYHPELPACAKTFLKTGQKKLFEIKKFKENDLEDKAKFVYIGMANNLRRTINVNLHREKEIVLQFSSDGLPLFKSSNHEFWPLLGRIHHEEVIYEPFIIAVHSGKGKPSCVDTYLQKFIEELNLLLNTGIEISGKKFDVKVMCFICDRPARAFLKCIKGHTGYFACERCTVKGYRESNRILYGVEDNVNRSDHSFRLQKQQEHHHSVSPLIRIQPPINMINDFVLDFMHLGCLGVMKKLLVDYWMKPSKSQIKRQDMLRVSQRMLNLSKDVPSEFQRTTRSLGEISKWKATEFRFFLLYCGMFVMKNILTDDQYQHFLLLATACRLLSCQKSCSQYADIAQIYLERFVLLAKELYGEETLVLNMHNLVHLADDVKYLDCCMSNLTAFPFENKLAQVKKCIRSGNKPLEQLCSRLEQEILYKTPTVLQIGLSKILKKTKCKEGIRVKNLQFCNSQLTTKHPNNCVLLKNKSVINIVSMHIRGETEDVKKVVVLGERLDIIEAGINYPLDSSMLNIFQVKKSHNMESVQISLSDIECKLVCLSISELIDDEKLLYVVPLLHM